MYCRAECIGAIIVDKVSQINTAGPGHSSTTKAPARSESPTSRATSRSVSRASRATSRSVSRENATARRGQKDFRNRSDGLRKFQTRQESKGLASKPPTKHSSRGRPTQDLTQTGRSTSSPSPQDLIPKRSKTANISPQEIIKSQLLKSKSPQKSRHAYGRKATKPLYPLNSKPFWFNTSQSQTDDSQVERVAHSKISSNGEPRLFVGKTFSKLS
eukprot:Selendium_serpulae@DN10074_c0_g1_i1.p1